MKSNYLRINDLVHVLPFSKATIWRKVKEGTFVKPVKLSARITAWSSQDVQNWIEAQKEASHV